MLVVGLSYKINGLVVRQIEIRRRRRFQREAVTPRRIMKQKALNLKPDCWSRFMARM